MNATLSLVTLASQKRFLGKLFPSRTSCVTRITTILWNEKPQLDAVNNCSVVTVTREQWYSPSPLPMLLLVQVCSQTWTDLDTRQWVLFFRKMYIVQLLKSNNFYQFLLVCSYLFLFKRCDCVGQAAPRKTSITLYYSTLLLSPLNIRSNRWHLNRT